MYAPVGLYLDDCVRCVDRSIRGREEVACIDLDVDSKYACTITGISVG
jgi:hypothetical protein